VRNNVLGRCLAAYLTTLALSGTGLAAPLFQQSGNTLVMSNGNVCLRYNLGAGTTDFYWKNSKKLSAFYSGISFNTGYIKGIGYSSWSYVLTNSNQAVITATGAGLPVMKQYFTLDQTDSFLVRVDAVGTNLSANWMGPVVVDMTGGVDLGVTNDNRALCVPFDNDGFVRYNAMSIDNSAVSYEVGAFYDNVTRNGLVVGSVTHDVWKSGVYFYGADNKLNQMNVFGGATSSWDVLPHGYISGNTISSPTMFVGFGSDWRVTMRNYAAANTNFVPALAWTNGVPFGWNSWGVIQQNINYAKAAAVSDFFHTNLEPQGFSNEGTAYINLDSYWNNLNSFQLQSFVNHCHANGQKAGIYLAPFAWFGSASSATKVYVEGTTNTFLYSAALLQDGSGNYQSTDGGLAMDPTHPATRERIDYYVNQFTNYGFDYVKLDFLSHGALEAAHYDTNVTTGIEAYNQGMQYILSAIAGRMFVSESIAPSFPYQYGHSRRISCDAQASLISNTEYAMNSVSYGWWLDSLYQFNDADIMVFGNGADTNEVQSRLISGAVTGLMLDGDDLTSTSGRTATQTCLTNAAINTVARVGQTFTPVEGNTGPGAVNMFVRQDGSVWHLAVFNYTSKATNLTVNLARIGLPGGYYTVSNLWDGTTMSVTGALAVSLNEKQSKLFSLTVPGVRSLGWTTNNNSIWDTGNTANWIDLNNKQRTAFVGGDQVLFDDAAGASATVTINGTVHPASVTVSSSTNSYTFNGPGTLAVDGTFAKYGSSLLTLTTPANITGPVQINGGTVYAGNYAFVNASCITITNNATLDFAGGALANGTPLIVSGTGVGGIGALYNSSYETYDNLLHVTLAGDTTFGGTSRWDLGPGSTITGPYKITINRANGVYGEWNGITLSNNVGNIELAGGKLGVKDMGSTFGNPAATVTVDADTELDFWTGEPGYAKHFEVLDNGTLQILTGFTNFNGDLSLGSNALFAAYGGSGGNQTFGGTITLNGIAHFMLGNGDFLFTNVISGPGGFVWNQYDHRIIFKSVNSYTGPTVIGNGLTLALAGNGSIAQSSLIFLGGNTPENVLLDVSGRPDNTLTLMSGQTLGGIGTINGRLTVNPGALLSPGGTNVLLNITNGSSSTGTIAVQKELTLNGSVLMKLNGSGVSDEIMSATKITYGGTLDVVNITGRPLAAGNSFQLFDAPVYSGTFSKIIPPVPGPGLVWDIAHLNSGILMVAPSPAITSVKESNAIFVFNGTNGMPAANYLVLTTTNLTVPPLAWTVIATNAFDSEGNFYVTNPIPPGAGPRFYCIQPF